MTTLPFATSITRLNSGGFVITQDDSDGAGASFSVYDAQGAQIGQTVLLTGTGTGADVTALAGGGFAVAWAEAPISRQIKTQTFDANGAATSSATVVSAATTTDAIARAHVTGLPTGGFVVSWAQQAPGSDAQIMLRTVGADNIPQSATGIVPFGANSDLTTLPDGRVVVVAADSIVTLSTYDPADGNVTSLTFAIPLEHNAYAPVVATLASGKIAVAYITKGQDGLSERVTVGVYDPAGSWKLSELPNEGTPVYGGPLAVTALPDGTFLVSYPNGTLAHPNQLIQLFDADATKIGAAVPLNSPTQNVPHNVVLGAVGANEVAIAYSDTGSSGETASLNVYHTVTGTASGDALAGTTGKDLIFGGAGDDMLTGGAGNDLMDGGDGNDIVVIGATRASTTITAASNDTLILTGPDGTDTLTSVQTIRFSDQDVAVSSFIISGTAGNDVLVGTVGDDVIDGRAGNNSLSGLAGNDVLIGGPDNDFVDGGEGFDTFKIGLDHYDGSLTPTVLPNGDIQLRSPGGNVDTLRSIEQIQFNSGNVPISQFALLGTAGNDDLTAGSGNVYVAGFDGNDTLRNGGQYGVTLDGGQGDDTYYISSSGGMIYSVIEAANGGNDTIHLSGLRDYGLENEVENLILDSAGGQTLVGNSLANRIVGNIGADTIYGGEGDDILVGGAGNDSLSGEAGNDVAVINVARSSATISVNGITGAVLVSSSEGLDSLLSVETIRFVDQDVATASLPPGSNTIGDANDNLLVGGSGDELFDGGGGNDTINGNGGQDRAIIHDTLAHSSITTPGAMSQGGTTFYPASPIVVDSADGHDTLSGIARIDFSDGTIYTANLSAIDAVFTPIFGRHPTSAEFAAFSNVLQTPLSAGQVQAIFATAEFDTFLTGAITALYQYYGGRSPTAAEIDVWKGNIRGGTSLATMRTIILDDPLGQNHSSQVIDHLYREYGGRPPQGSEVAIWKSIIRDGHDFDFMRQAILNDPLGQNYTNAAVTAIYQGLAGRSPTADEIAAAKAMLLGGGDYIAVRTAVLGDTTIHAYEVAQITAAYQTYGGRAPTSDELTVWDGALKSGASYGTIRDAILHDPLGNYHYDQQITAAYQTYGGRAPTSGELAVWEGALRGNGDNVAVIKDAILHDPLGRYYVDQQITAAYQTYGGRAPTSGELTVWENAIGTSGNYGIVKDAILRDPLGNYYHDQQITQAYQTYGGRAPTSGELAVWEGALRANGGNAAIVRDAILNDPLGKAYVDAQITAAYQTYGGRAPTSGELTVWENALNGNNHEFSLVKSAILSDPLGAYTDTQIGALYQRYFGRAPSPAESGVWHSIIRNGADLDTLRDVLMSDGGSAATTTQLTGTSGTDTFHFASKPYIAISGFDPAHDVIDLQGLGFSAINPLDAAHARQIHAYDGANEVLITLDASHEILLHNVALAQLSTGDFLL